MSIHPDPSSIHVHLTSRPSRTSFPSFLPSFQSQASLFLKSPFQKNWFFSLYLFSLFLFFLSFSLSWHNRTFYYRHSCYVRFEKFERWEYPNYLYARSCPVCEWWREKDLKIKLWHTIRTLVQDTWTEKTERWSWSVHRIKITRKKKPSWARRDDRAVRGSFDLSRYEIS